MGSNLLWNAIVICFQPSNLGLIILGFLLGHLFGLLPGLSGMVAVAILIPLSYGMEMAPALIFLISILGGGTFAGSITAILLGIPGQAMNAMTILDGHPLALQGKGAMAIGASATASALGSVFSLILLALSIPFVNRIVLLFSPPECFAIVTVGMVAIAMASVGQMLNGLISGALGLLFASIGFNSVVGGLRFTYGIDYLWGGIPAVPVFVGIYAVGEFIDLAVRRKEITPAKITNIGQGLWDGVKSVFEHWFLWLRCTIIGFIVGVIPGLGGDAAAVITYAHAVQTEKNTENFGKGDIRGVIAPESSNNSKDGGQLMPTFALGIPGSVPMAILMGAFLIHGIQPGQNMFTTHLNIVWIVIVAYSLSNIFTSLFGMALGGQLAKLVNLPPPTYMPAIIIMGLLGAYVASYSFTDVLVTVTIGFVGYALKVFNFPRIPLIIGYVLGGLFEKFYFQSLQMSRGSYMIFFTRPVVLVLWAFLILSLVLYFRQSFKKKEHIEVIE